jgi:predicted ABC-type transport system involved in lysophospholipase L1 biosynthesis ATPase subunit
VLIDNVDITKLDEDAPAKLREKIGFVFQFFHLIPLHSPPTRTWPCRWRLPAHRTSARAPSGCSKKSD